MVEGLGVGEKPVCLASGRELGRSIAVDLVAGAKELGEVVVGGGLEMVEGLEGGERPACYALGRERGRPKAFGSVTGGVEEVVAGRSEGGWE